MAKLKANVKTLIEIDSNDLEDLVNEVYGGDYSFVADTEANNYSSYEYTVPDADVDDDNTELEAKIRRGMYPPYCTNSVLKVLYEDGHLDAGEYLIKVFW